MDWPGTGSVVAMPLITPLKTEALVRILMVFEVENGGGEYAASAVKYVHVDPE
jgi:hypothetical protein